MLDWHLSYWGTRPSCSLEHPNPLESVGFIAAMFHENVPAVPTDSNSETKLRNWRSGKHPPTDERIIANIFQYLFDGDERLTEWRDDLQGALSKVRDAGAGAVDAKRMPEANPGEATEPEGSEVQLPIFGQDARDTNTTASSDAPLSPTAPNGAGFGGQQVHEAATHNGVNWPKSHAKSILAAMTVVVGIAATTHALLTQDSASGTQDVQASSGSSVANIIAPEDRIPDAVTRRLVLIQDGGSLLPLNQNQATSELARHFIEWVKPEIDRIAAGYSQPIIVQTTLDLSLQQAAIGAVQPILPNGAEGALVSMENDGAILAMMGGTNTFTKPNLSIDPLREAGSVWRIFVYLDALQRGYKASTHVVDEPLEINGWQVPSRNYVGSIDLLTAFAYSKNAVTMKLAIDSGYEPKRGFTKIEAEARRFGITTPISSELSMPLGVSKVRLIEIARAFAILSARGKWVAPFGVMKITTTDGKVIYEKETLPSRNVVASDVADGLVELLQGAAETGAAKPASFGRPIAGITGTSLSAGDGWFVGFSSGVTTGVWMGRPDGIAVNLMGGRTPARAFGSFMEIATPGRPTRNFETPLILPAWNLED